jgi:hypothetical protein
MTRTLAAEDAVRRILREASATCRPARAFADESRPPPQADHRCADHSARQRRCDGERRQEELIRAPRAAANGTEAAVLTSGVPAMPLPAQPRASLFGGKVPRAGTASRIAIGTARGPDLAGRSGAKAPCACPSIGGCPPLPCHLGRQGACPICDAGENGTPRCFTHWQARTSGPGVKIAHPAREDLRGVQSVAHSTLPGFSARSQVALLDLAFQVRSRVRR